MRVNVSRIQARLWCPAYEHYRYRLKRAPAFSGAALYTGTAVHRFFELMLTGTTVQDSLAAMDAEFVKAFLLVEEGSDQYAKLHFDQRLMHLLLPHWKKPDDWKILGTEKMLEVETPINKHTLFGRLDALVDWNGRLWHLQHKTASIYTPVSIYVKQIQRSWHENVYAAMVRREFPDRIYGGTCLNMVRKVTLKDAQSKPENAFKIEFIPITMRSMNSALVDLDGIVDTMHFEELDAQARPKEFKPAEYRDACTGKFGNSLCPYLDVCEGTDTILSTRYADVDPLAAYGGTQEGTE